MCSKLVGAKPNEIVATGSTTINIHQLVNTFYQPKEKRKKIIADELTFPTDIYALRSLVKLRNQNPTKNLILIPSEDGRFLDENKIVEAMNEEVSLAFLPSVLYRSGQLLDMKYLTEEAHKREILIGFDCSHSVGVVPHHLDDLGVDFGTWCSYKYLNGGPGATAFVYINEKHFNREPAFAGWWGYKKGKQFDMSIEFKHAKSAGGWQISSPTILSSAPLKGSLDVILEAGIDEIRKKSLKMTSYLMFLVDETLSEKPYNFSIGTPKEDERRGGHVAVEHKEGMRINEALRKKGVVSDFRPPNIVRVAPIPLYCSYHDVWKTAESLREIIDNKEYEKIPKKRKAIS